MSSAASVDGSPAAAVDPNRIDRTCDGDGPTRVLIERLLGLSERGLARMYDAEKRRFAHCLRRAPNGQLEREGESLRYAGTALLGIRWLGEDRQRAILAGETAAELCTRLLPLAAESTNLGDAAMVAWAAAELGHPDTDRALDRALALEREQTSPFTVEIAWLLSALTASKHRPTESDARRIAHDMLENFPHRAGVFPHRVGQVSAGLRQHVACFADQVYPIQALARLHSRFGAERGLSAAMRCAGQIIRVQGDAGQWWWHYDARTGAVVEGYPIYSVHQDSMAPMALFDLEEACGRSYREAIVRGLRWIDDAPEVGGSLIDDDESIVWRKVTRIGPSKAMRMVRAAASRLHGDLRLHFLNPAFPPRSIDWECRPYHLAWVLHAWLTRA